mgnify:CR=1 FL=1
MPKLFSSFKMQKGCIIFLDKQLDQGNLEMTYEEYGALSHSVVELLPYVLTCRIYRKVDMN